MQAISIWQPYASLIAYRAKPYETRHWAPPRALIGRRIAIHAAARRPTRAEVDGLMDDVSTALGRRDWDLRIPYGAIVCTAVLDAAFELGEPTGGTARPAARVVQRMTSRPMPACFSVLYDDFGDYAEGRWAWLLRDVEPLNLPVPFKGRQGFFDIDDRLAKAQTA